jgi:hypothetical protein
MSLLNIFRASLARSRHSLTVVGDKAYIFGGETSDGKLAATDIHVITLLSDADAEKQGETQYAQLVRRAAKDRATKMQTQFQSREPDMLRVHSTCA